MHGPFSYHHFDPKKTWWMIQKNEDNHWFWQRSLEMESVSIIESQGGFASFADAKQEAVKMGYPGE